MFDIAPTEMLLVALVALVVIGPKDLPKVMRVVGHWVGKARGMARQFRSGFDAMVREAELEEMEKKWREENERIMREHPPEPAPDSTSNTAALPAYEPAQDETDQAARDIAAISGPPPAPAPPAETAAPEEPAPEKPRDGQLDLGLGGNPETRP